MADLRKSNKETITINLNSFKIIKLLRMQKN